MSDLDDELNFDDISGQKKPAPKKEKPKKDVVSGKTANTTGIVMAMPTDDPNVYIHLDLAECTGAEFVKWAKGVYPVDLSEHEENLNNVNHRARAFRGIVHYHTHSLFQAGKTPKKNTTVN